MCWKHIIKLIVICLIGLCCKKNNMPNPNINRRIVLPVNPISYIAQANTLFAQMSVQPPSYQAANINTLISTLVSNSIWNKIDALWIMAAHDQQAARLNWKSPGTFTLIEKLATKENVKWTRWKGYKDGANNYLQTGWNYSTSSVNFTQNNACSFIYSNTNVQVQGASAGARNVTSNNEYLNWTDGKVYFNVNHSGDSGVNYTKNSSIGFFAGDRSASNLTTLYVDGVSVATNATGSLGLLNLTDYILCTNSNGSALFPSGAEISVRGFASSLSAGEHLILYNAIQTYLTNCNSYVSTNIQSNNYIMLAGQSNATDICSSASFPYLVPVIPDVSSYYGWYYQPYQAGVTSFNGVSGGGAFGVSAVIAYRLKNTYNWTKLKVLNSAVSGACLVDAVNNTWCPTTASTTPRYAEMIRMWTNNLLALGDLTPNLYVVWIQGEGDINDAPALAAYETNLTNLITQWRTDTGLPNLKFIIVKIGLNATFYAPAKLAAMRTAQDNVAAGLSNVYTIEAPTSYEADGVHYSATGCEDVGQRIADLISTL